MATYHPVFGRFDRHAAFDTPEFHVNFMGSRTRHAFERPLAEVVKAQGYRLRTVKSDPLMSSGRCVEYVEEGTLPSPLAEDYYEWIDVLEAIEEAGDSFNMIELGAGYGRWVINAAAAIQNFHGRRPSHLWLCAVEPSKQRIAWMREHFADNDVDPAAHRLIEAGVSADGLRCAFQSDTPATDGYGQTTIPVDWTSMRADAAGFYRKQQDGSTASFVMIPTVTVPDVIGDRIIDLLDIDVQGHEVAIIEPFIELIAQRVKRLHIGTHTAELHTRLGEIVAGAGFQMQREFLVNSNQPSEFGVIRLIDGLQSWINPALAGASRR
jgi:FkbM family methyltransferase